MPPLPKKGLREAIESLRAISPRLNAITDLANETVRDVEAFLNEECSLGVTAAVCICGSDDSPEGTYLEYRRVGPRFRIAIVETNSDGEDTSIKAWADSTRTEKLDSFKLLPQLLTVLSGKVEEEIVAAENTAKTVSEIIGHLRRPGQPKP